jgi:uncharacterized protein (TIGR02757 family)
MRSDNLSIVKSKNDLWNFLEKNVGVYNRPSFIPEDPISVPHRFSKKQDIEIAGLFAAIFSWGNRTTIIRKSNELMKFLDDSPHDFIRNHRPVDLKPLVDFKHRTFNTTDLLYFIDFLKHHYKQSDSLETAFLTSPKQTGEKKHPAKIRIETGQPEKVKSALSVFYKYFFSLKNAPLRTRKHISSPDNKSTCKRLNMYLRWMVRTDNNGVDFGIWNTISPSDLICPVDLHVARVARRFGLISRKQTDWETAMELTRALRDMDPKDPVKYDFALFGLGVMEKY